MPHTTVQLPSGAAAIHHKDGGGRRTSLNRRYSIPEEKSVQVPFNTQWRKALVSLPRLVPRSAVRCTAPDGPYPHVVKIKSRSCHLIPLHVFIPPIVYNSPTTPKLPVLVDFHGGSFVFGSCMEQATFCAKLARELNCLAISVDYRLGPYSQFPAAIEDAEDVVRSIIDPTSPTYQTLRSGLNKIAHHVGRKAGCPTHKTTFLEIDDSRIAVSGFSSGGNLALNLAISIDPQPQCKQPWPSVFSQHRAQPLPLLLFYPSLDCRQLPSERSLPPGLVHSKGFFAKMKVEDVLMPTYLPRHKAAHPRASPGLADLSGLHDKARMMLVLPELDSLAAQTKVWVDKVHAEGFGERLEIVNVPGCKHGWTQFPDRFLKREHRRTKMEVFNRAVAFVRQAWGVAD